MMRRRSWLAVCCVGVAASLLLSGSDGHGLSSFGEVGLSAHQTITRNAQQAKDDYCAGVEPWLVTSDAPDKVPAAWCAASEESAAPHCMCHPNSICNQPNCKTTHTEWAKERFGAAVHSQCDDPWYCGGTEEWKDIWGELYHSYQDCPNHQGRHCKFGEELYNGPELQWPWFVRVYREGWHVTDPAHKQSLVWCGLWETVRGNTGTYGHACFADGQQYPTWIDNHLHGLMQLRPGESAHWSQILCQCSPEAIGLDISDCDPNGDGTRSCTAVPAGIWGLDQIYSCSECSSCPDYKAYDVQSAKPGLWDKGKSGAIVQKAQQLTEQVWEKLGEWLEAKCVLVRKAHERDLGVHCPDAVLLEPPTHQSEHKFCRPGEADPKTCEVWITFKTTDPVTGEQNCYRWYNHNDEGTRITACIGEEIDHPACPPDYCGDGICSSGEDCSTCPSDCGDCAGCSADDCCPGRDDSCNSNGCYCDEYCCVAGDCCENYEAVCGTLGGDSYPECSSDCGDGTCGAGEDCTSCPYDCGSCEYCGDGACNAGEDCYSCSYDCGSCEYCGDGACNAGEDCYSCSYDCGSCEYCGDGLCNGSESCSSCPSDCGACSYCGDGFCNGSESCSTCPGDCGSCSYCGDGICGGGESCSTCPGDCGSCGGSCVGNCDGYAGSCYCDSLCVSYGDCCSDACTTCGYCG